MSFHENTVLMQNKSDPISTLDLREPFCNDGGAQRAEPATLLPWKPKMTQSSMVDDMPRETMIANMWLEGSVGSILEVGTCANIR